MATNDDVYGTDYNEDRGLGQPSARSAESTKDASTAQPERDLQPGNPNLTGGAPAPEKKGMADKMKGILEGLKQKRHGRNSSGSAVGSGVGHHTDASPYGTGAGDDYTGGHSLDPTGAPAGNAFGEKGAQGEGGKYTPEGPGPWPHPTSPKGRSAALSDEHGNLQDGVKKEGFLSKLKDKLHSPKRKQETS